AGRGIDALAAAAAQHLVVGQVGPDDLVEPIAAPQLGTKHVLQTAVDGCLRQRRGVLIETDELERSRVAAVALAHATERTAIDPVQVAIERPVADRSGDADRKSTRLNSSHVKISYAVFCL